MQLAKWVRSFIGYHLVRKTATLQVGGVFGMLIQAFAGVLIARILQPEGYGIYALAFSVATISSVFIGGGIVDAITPTVSRAWAQHDPGQFQNAIGFYFRFVGACMAVTVGVLVLLPFITNQLYGDSSIGMYAVVIVIASIISVSIFALVQLILNISGRISTLAGVTLTDVVVRYSLMLTLSAIGFGIWGAVAGHFFGALIMLAVAVWVYVRLQSQESLLPRFGILIEAARKVSWQPLLKPTLWVLADTNFALLYGALPVAMVGLYASGAELAYFKLAFGYIILAMAALGPISILLNVHFPTLQATDDSRLRYEFIRVTFYATLLSAAITFLVVVFSPVVFRFLYGQVYLPAIPYVYGLTIFGALFGVGVGLGPMWRAVDRVHISILINLVILALGIPLGIWLISQWHIWGAIVMVTLWYTISHIISFVYLLRTLKSGQK